MLLNFEYYEKNAWGCDEKEKLYEKYQKPTKFNWFQGFEFNPSNQQFIKVTVSPCKTHEAPCMLINLCSYSTYMCMLLIYKRKIGLVIFPHLKILYYFYLYASREVSLNVEWAICCVMCAKIFNVNIGWWKNFLKFCWCRKWRFLRESLKWVE